MLQNPSYKFFIVTFLLTLFFNVAQGQPCPTGTANDYTFSPLNPSPAGCTELCPDELFTWTVTGGNGYGNAISLDLFYSTTPGFNPALGQGILIESIPITSCPEPNGPVVINEIMHNPNAFHNDGDVTNSYTGEWVELAGTPGTDIGCYILTDGDWAVTIPPGTVIPPSGYFTIGYNEAWTADGVTFDLDLGVCACFIAYDAAGMIDLNANFIFTNGGEWLVLFDGNTVTYLDGVQFGSPSGGNTYPNGFLMTVAAATGVFPQVSGIGCVPSAINPLSFPPSLPNVAFPLGNIDEYTIHRDLDYTGALIQQSNLGGTLADCNTPMPPAFPFVIDSSFDDTFCGQTLYMIGIVQTNCGMNDYPGQMTTEYEVCIVCPEENIAGTHCLDYTYTVGGDTYDSNNPNGTTIVPGVGGDCDTTFNVNLSFHPANTATLSGGGSSCANMNYNMEVLFSGDGPWTFVHSINTFDMAPITTNNNPYTLVVPVGNVNLNIGLTSVTDTHGCNGTVFGNEGITVTPTPTISIGPDDSSCSGQNVTIPITFTGTAPFMFSYTANSGATINVTTNNNPYDLVVSPAFNTTYVITSFEDDNCAGTIANSTAVITVNAAPFVNITPQNASVCQGESVDIDITVNGTENYTINYLLNNVPQTPINFDDAGYTLSLNPLVNSTVIFTSISDGNSCTFPLTNTVDITIVAAPTATFIIDDETICENDTETINFYWVGQPPVTIYYSLDGVPQAPIMGNVTPIPFVINSAGVYAIDSIQDMACSTTVMDTLTVVETTNVLVSNIDHICNFVDGTYTVTFDLSGGTGTYSVNNVALVGSTFTSTPIASNANYDFLVTDGSGCSDQNIQGSFNCDCPNFSGNMPSDTIHLCEGEDLMFDPANGYVLTATDTIMYVIHDLAGTTLGTIYFTDYSTFTILNGDLPNVYETVFYISSVTGPALPNGQVDLMDACVLVSPGTPFILHQNPDFTVVQDEYICPNEEVTFFVQSTGSAPFTFTYTFGSTTQTITTNDVNHALMLSNINSQELIVSSFSDANCSIPKQDTAAYDVIPTISYLNLNAECDFTNGTYTVSFDLLGGEGAYFVDGVQLAANSFMSTDFAASTNYDFSIWSEAMCDTIFILGLQSCDCPNDSGNMSTDTVHVCDGEDLAFDLATDFVIGGLDAIMYIIHDQSGTSLGTQYGSSFVSPFPSAALSALDLETTYYISAVTGTALPNGQVDLTDDCAIVAAGTPFVIHGIPTANMPTDITVCEGDCAMIPVSFVGTAPFDYSYTIDAVVTNEQALTNDAIITICADDYLPGTTNLVIGITSVSSPFCTATAALPSIDVTFEAVVANTFNNVLCQGDTVLINGIEFHENNLSEIDTMYNASGCIGQINSLVFDVVMPSTQLFQDTYCSTDTITIGGQEFHLNNTNDIIVLDDANIDGCDSTLTVDLTFLPIIVASIEGDTAICDEANVPISLTLPTGVTGDITILINNVPTVYNNVSNGFSFDILLNEDTEVMIGDFVTATPNCGITQESVVNLSYGDVGVELMSTADYGGFDVSCSGGDGQISSTVLNGAAPIDYLWSDNSTSTSLSDVNSGQYFVQIEDADGCVAYDTIVLTQAAQMAVYTRIIEPLCFGDASGFIVIDSVVGSNGPFFYQLSGSVEEAVVEFPVVIPSVGVGDYELSISDEAGCIYTEEIEMTEPVAPFLQLVGDNEISLGDSTLLSTQTSFDVDTLIWSPTTHLACDTCSSTWASPVLTTNYQVTAVDTNGCTVSSNLLVTVTVDRTVFVPTIFTPNADGINDFLFIQGSQDIEEIVSFSVFSRWGEKLFFLEHFQPNIYANGWRGDFHDQQLNVGVYMYHIEVLFKDGVKEYFSGDVTLMR